MLVACWASCAPPSSREPPSLFVGRATDAIALDPARITDSESAEVCDQIYEHLVRSRKGSTEIEPALATRWEVQDGRVFTFHLRPGVRFHDGSPFTADAVVFSFERQRDPHHPFHRNDFPYESLFKDIVSVEKIDPLTVRLVIKEAYAPFLANLSMFPMSIVSPQAVARFGDRFAEHPVGTGPFRFVEWSRGERITLEAYDEYWGGRPRLDHLAFVPVPDPRQRLVKLEGSAIGIAENLAPQDFQFVTLHPELRTIAVAGHNVSYLAMNTRHPPFDDLRVRRAVALAIDKSAIVKLVYQGQAEVATGPLAPSMWGHLERKAQPPVPAQARALLAAALYDHARTPKLFVPATPRPYLPSPLRVARMIAQNLHDVGMDVELVVNPIDDHLKATAAGEHDLCLLGWTADNGDPDNILYTLFDSDNAEPGTARNLSFFTDSALDGILERAQETLDRAQRTALYRQAQEIVASQVPLLPIAHANLVVAYRRSVQGLWLPPNGTLQFRDVTLSERP